MTTGNLYITRETFESNPNYYFRKASKNKNVYVLNENDQIIISLAPNTNYIPFEKTFQAVNDLAKKYNWDQFPPTKDNFMWGVYCAWLREREN